MTEEHPAAEAAHAEATGRVKALTIGEGEDQIVLEIPRKWKRFKFVRALRRGDIAAAVDAIWPPTPLTDDDGAPVLDVLGNPAVEPHPSVAELEDADLDDEEFGAVMEALATSLGGMSAGNSSASPTS